ncbi:MAG TPA: hypothetical protein VE732_08670 [Nitrososphaera sp.]|nr:hypothetical protein [Nitrososphaera sp.]
MKAELAPPEAGWTTVTLSAGEGNYQFFPSHVPYDSVSELVNALLKILDGYPEAIVRWNDEPVEHEFVFVSECEQVNFTVYEIIDSIVAGKMRDEKFAFSGPRSDVLRPFWKGLRDMQSKQNLKEYERQWREPFPEREMFELTQRIKELKPNGANIGAV